jgi:hypothetical protein
MVIKTINGVRYCLDEKTLTAEVIQKDGYKGDIIIPETVEHESVSYRVTSIGPDAFAYSDLKSVVIPDSVTIIDAGAFEDSYLTAIVIPDSVTSIGSCAFNYCDNLLSIVIGKSVTIIFYEAFADCHALASITYNGTMAQWKQIELYEDWNVGVPATVVHCTDGDVEIG